MTTTRETRSPSFSPQLLARAAKLSSATLHEASGRAGALPAFIRPTRPGIQLVGPALPVSGPPGDNLWLHRAIYEARPGEVLVVDTGQDRDFGYWGEVMAVAAMTRGIPGLVIVGGVRDVRRMAELNFPVFSGAVTIRGTGKDPLGHGQVGARIRLGDAVIDRGDLIFGDDDGVVVVAAHRAAEVIALSEERERKETFIFEQLRGGATTIDIYDLPRQGSDAG